MASKASNLPFLRAVAKRGFSANACPRPLGMAADVQSTVLGNKVVVAAADASLPIARVSVVFRAGSRNETYDLQGATHMMRVATGLSTINSSGFAITRNIQQIGGSLTCTSDREIVAYTVETTADQIETGLNFLQDVIQPAFKPWELADSLGRVRSQVAAVSPQVRAVELLHRAAFRTGLGNSLYIPKFQIGKLSSESLLHYVANNCTASRCAVVGVGIEHNALSGFAQSLELKSGGGKSEGAIYHGGDARKDTPGNIAHVAVAGSGGSLLNQKEALAFAILQHALGAGAATKRGNINGGFGKALASAAKGGPVSFTALNACYSDAGLFGFVLSADSQTLSKSLESVVNVLKAPPVTAEDVARGKALLKSSVLQAYSTDSGLINEMGVQAVLTKQVINSDALLAAIDAVALEDVQQAAKKVGTSKLSIGAVGNLANVPYASDLA